MIGLQGGWHKRTTLKNQGECLASTKCYVRFGSYLRVMNVHCSHGQCSRHGGLRTPGRLLGPSSPLSTPRASLQQPQPTFGWAR